MNGDKAWQQDHNAKVALVLGGLAAAELALYDVARACLALPKDDLTVANLRTWALDTAARVKTEGQIARRMLL